MKNKLIQLMRNSKIVDIPKYYPKEKYTEASKEYIKLINPKKNKIKSIYQVGSIGVPGISDLDYFIVFENADKDFFGKYHILNLSPVSKYLFYHNCWFTNDSIMKNMNYWFPYFNLDLVWGKKISTKKIKNENINLILSTQYLINKIPYDLIDYSIKRGKFYQRTMLVSINSLKHTVKLLEQLGLAKKEWIKFCKDFEKFRDNWFNEKNKDEKLKKYATESILLSLDIIEVFNEVLEKKNKIISPKKSFSLKLKEKKIVFIKKWNKKGVLEKYINDSSDDIRYYPLSFGYYFYLRSINSNRLGIQFKKIFPKTLQYKIPKKIEKTFNLYEKYLNEYNDFCKKKFWMTASGYHISWLPYYENRIINWIYDKMFKARELSIILFKKYLKF